MPVAAILATLCCSDLAASEPWFTHLFGRAPDIAPQPGVLEWHHGGQAGFQLLEDAGRAGRGALSLRVAPLDTELARLGLAPPEARAEIAAPRLLHLMDPDGNVVTLIEAV